MRLRRRGQRLVPGSHSLWPPSPCLVSQNDLRLPSGPVTKMSLAAYRIDPRISISISYQPRNLTKPDIFCHNRELAR
jgi:hypothetical protein